MITRREFKKKLNQMDLQHYLDKHSTDISSNDIRSEKIFYKLYKAVLKKNTKKIKKYSLDFYNFFTSDRQRQMWLQIFYDTITKVSMKDLNKLVKYLNENYIEYDELSNYVFENSKLI